MACQWNLCWFCSIFGKHAAHSLDWTMPHPYKAVNNTCLKLDSCFWSLKWVTGSPNVSNCGLIQANRNLRDMIWRLYFPVVMTFSVLLSKNENLLACFLLVLLLYMCLRQSKRGRGDIWSDRTDSVAQFFFFTRTNLSFTLSVFPWHQLWCRWWSSLFNSRLANK